MKIRYSVLLGAAICCLTTACQTNTPSTAKTDAVGPVKPLPKTQEGVVKVQHILIGFQGSVPRKDIKRTMAESGQLAQELLAKAKEGADFGDLVKEHTNDSAPGIYFMADNGVDAMLFPGEVFNRSDMAKSFGDVSFQLKVGEVGLAEYNVLHSPFGWHIIKRLE
ncbi:MAG: peptidylprolyl isomerase [Pirellulaceae bacterium]|nr:peptidylprolyl isomerase [Pirellulaceae bacterium]